MRCYIRLLSQFLVGVCLLVTVVTAVQADGISVNKAELRSAEGGYQLAADFEVNLSFVVQQALSRGVPIYFVGEFSLTRSRWYWLDEQIFQSTQPIRLSYNVLTRQYRIARGSLYQNFSSLEEVLNIVSRQTSSVIPSAAFNKEGRYIAAARLRLDISQLPSLLQVNALTSKEWDIDSDWYRWVLDSSNLAGRLSKTE